MYRIFKIALLSLIVLALPIQGVAAATLVLCGPMHQRMAMAGQSETAAVHSAHDHTHHHGSVTAQTHSHDSAAGAYDFQTNLTDQTDKYSCSACAACCTGAMLAGPGYRAPVLIFTAVALVPSNEAPFSGFIPEGPEHPPRHILV